MNTNTVTSVESKLMAAVARAIAASATTGVGWNVCIKSPDGETLVRLVLAEYEQVCNLSTDLRSCGYHMEILHPEHMACDFVLKTAEPRQR